MLQAVIARPEAANPEKVDKLVKYCKSLDGTEVKVVPISREKDLEFCRHHSNNQFFQLQAYALRSEAEAVGDIPFLHLEPDSVPIKKGWLKAISDEYVRLGKSYLLPWDTHAPGDLIGGIGVYGENTRCEIPCEFPSNGWDMWMINNIPGKIARTPLIQHKYGIYEGMDKVRDITFPRDHKLIRPETVLFHRDITQSLMAHATRDCRYAHSGCLGDTIAALKTIQWFGGGHLVMTNKGNKRELRGVRYEYLRPLLEAQPYLRSVTWEEEPQDIQVDFTDFRTIYDPRHSLAWIQAKYAGLDLTNVDAWITAKPDPKTKGNVVISRSMRYHNDDFPWAKIAELLGNKLLFIGLDDEHEDIQRVCGMKIDRLICPDALRTAEAIQGADLFIGNQSSSFWIAVALGKRIIQETWLAKSDSIIARPGAFYWKEASQTESMFSFLKNKC